MQLGLKLNRNGTVGLRDQIVTQLARLILDGHLQPGMRLPSCRKFAKELEVSVNTVIAAYEILEEQQLILPRSRSGFFVLAEQGVRNLQPESAKLNKPSPLRDRLNWHRLSDDLATIVRPETWYDFKSP
ncbi:MAG: winged helix-turn-helix transcriptional regulator, partial [Boseongicola sp. SB0664_bin_43]|nr:winged helix-turn-helix transcriptional regulator [Boseongicola sp. SB0664_bin_43]